MVCWCRCDSWTRPLRRLREFRVNPLEAIDRQAKMERAFDQWVRPIMHSNLEDAAKLQEPTHKRSAAGLADVSAMQAPL